MVGFTMAESLDKEEKVSWMKVTQLNNL